VEEREGLPCFSGVKRLLFSSDLMFAEYKI